MTPAVYIGYDHREVDAYGACISSLRAHARGRFTVHPVSYTLLGMRYRRAVQRNQNGLWDPISQAPMSTDFSLARFWVPLLHQRGPALFCDGDFMFRAPVEDLFDLYDPRYIVQVVQHDQAKGGDLKMDGQVQTHYPRKNWSSLVLFNCNGVLASGEENYLEMVNTAAGVHLHRFAWLPDALIGTLPLEWNWLAGISPADVVPKAVHYTLGIPRMRGYENAPYADEWRAHARRSASPQN